MEYLNYKGKEYKSVELTLSSGEHLCYAQSSLLDDMERNNDLGCSLADKIAFYPSEEQIDELDRLIDSGAVKIHPYEFVPEREDEIIKYCNDNDIYIGSFTTLPPHIENMIDKHVESYTKDDAERKQETETWTWKDYGDSGVLVAPDGKEYFSYDAYTREYKITPEHGYEYEFSKAEAEDYIRKEFPDAKIEFKTESIDLDYHPENDIEDKARHPLPDFSDVDESDRLESNSKVLYYNNISDRNIFIDWFNKNKTDNFKEIQDETAKAIMFYAPAWHEPFYAEVMKINDRMGIRTRFDDLRVDIDFLTPEQFIEEAHKTLSDRTKEYDTGEKNYRSVTEENRENSNIRIMLQDKDVLEYVMGMIDDKELLSRRRMGNYSLELNTEGVFERTVRFFDEHIADTLDGHIESMQVNGGMSEAALEAEYTEHEQLAEQDEEPAWTDADIAQGEYVGALQEAWEKHCINNSIAGDEMPTKEFEEEFSKKYYEEKNQENENDYADSIESMEAFVNGTDEERAAMTKEFREHTKKRQMERDKQNLKYAGKVLESGDSIIVVNEHVGEIYVDSGNVGKSGNGLQHMIEQRFEKDGKSVDEIAALLGLVVDSASNGTVARDTKIIQNNQDIGTYDLEKNGIIAFISKTRDGNDEKFVITGFDDFSKKEQATDAIKTVIANNSYDSDFVIVKNQTVAVLASAYNLHLQDLNVNIEKAKNATNVGIKKQFTNKVEKLEKIIEKYNSNDDIKEAVQKVNENRKELFDNLENNFGYKMPLKEEERQVMVGNSQDNSAIVKRLIPFSDFEKLKKEFNEVTKKYNELHAKVYEHCTVTFDGKTIELKEGLLNSYCDVREELDSFKSMKPGQLRHLAHVLDKKNKGMER